MHNPLKRFIQKQLYNRCYKKYQDEVAYQNNRYARYLEAHGETDVLFYNHNDFCPLAKGMKLKIGRLAIVFYQDNGILENRAVGLFDACFAKNPTCVFAYANQDYLDEECQRHSPWFKPSWSPDTLADSFYPGSVFALRKSLVQKKVEENAVSLSYARSLVFETIQMSMKKIGISAAGCSHPQVELVDEILFHEFYEQPRKGVAEYERRQNPIQDDRLDLPVSVSPLTLPFFQNKETPFVSVIIPSKDNPQVLKRCLYSLREKTEKIQFEVIVVDNGSDPSNKAVVEKLCEQMHATYLYQPMPFNFSAMCNLGAAKAKGNYLLFLNDDMEILSSDWMLSMWEIASRKHVGAVGAKLYYPNTTTIQHAGVTNLEIGPAHKMQKDDDRISYYHGRNRGIHDMLAVTAACMMVERRKFNQVGGFCQDIAVAYNDVDFCFSLFEEGYYNVQRNDVVLYHHESLSRGNDELSQEKWERLLQEKETLYRRHPSAYGKDPFYSKGLAGNFSDYICSFEYPYEKRGHDLAKCPKQCKDPSQYENGCLIIKLEQKEAIRRCDLREPVVDDRRLEGWSYVLHNDSMRYRRFLIFKNEKTGLYYRVPVNERYRRDAELILEGESEHTALAGFYAFVSFDALPKGNYRIGMLAKDLCSSQKLFAMTQETICLLGEEE